MPELTQAVSAPRGTIRINGNRIEPFDGRLITGNAAVTADLAYLSWFQVDNPMAVTAMEYFCQTAAGNVDLGVFSTTDFATFTLLSHTGATGAVGSNAVQSINLLASVPLSPGVDYFAAIVGSSASLIVGKQAVLQGVMAANKTAYQKAALDPLATFSTPANTGILNWMALK